MERFFCFGKRDFCDSELCSPICEFCDDSGGLEWNQLEIVFESIFGEGYDLSRLRELVQADRDGRCVVIPSGGFDDKDGENALKSAMHTVFYHNNPVTRYIADAVSEKLVREAAEKALEGEKNG